MMFKNLTGKLLLACDTTGLLSELGFWRVGLYISIISSVKSSLSSKLSLCTSGGCSTVASEVNVSVLLHFISRVWTFMFTEHKLMLLEA